MDQFQSFHTENLKFLNIGCVNKLGYLKRIFTFKKCANVDLLELSSHLNQWNFERVSNKNINGQSLNLSLEDVNTLKEIIRIAIYKSAIHFPEVVYDQFLFLTIGAIQVQTQTGSDKAWTLLDQSIKSHLVSRKERQAFSIGLATSTMLLCLVAMILTNHSIRRADDLISNSTTEFIKSYTDPVTISMLQLAYSKMKSGTCQLPQAAMLPIEQRQAFLVFVNTGTIDVNHVENLRLALGYVNCLYPQELMRPQLPN